MPRRKQGAKQQRAHNAYAVLFVVLLCCTVGLLTYATNKLAYTWNWNKVTQFFWDTSRVDIKSRSNGVIENIASHESSTVITIKSSNISGTIDDIEFPSKAEIIKEKGSKVFRGDVIASYKANSPGLLLQGLGITMKASFFAILIGSFVGLATGLSRLSHNPCLRWGAITYIELVRGTPLLVQLFLWYYVLGTIADKLLSEIGLPAVPPLWYGIFALAIFSGAYIAEIVRAGIQSVHWGQMEAARSLGLTHVQAMRKVILPQAFRRILPPLAGQFISLIKDSSLLGVMGIAELTKQTQDAISFTFQSFEFWFTCAFLYLALTFSLSLFVQLLEQRAIRR